MSNIFLFFLALSWGHLPFFSSLEAATLHAIIVTDTQNDSIGESAKQDAKIMQSEVRSIAEATGLELNEHLFSGERYQIEAIKECVLGLEVTSEDVLFYYHAGHSIERSMGVLDPFPIMDFGPQESLSIFEVVRAIRYKAPRLGYIFIDACNARVGGSRENKPQPQVEEQQEPVALISAEKKQLDEKQKLQKPLILQELQQAHYRRLFLEPRGMVVVLAATAGSSAWSSSKLGGMATFLWQKILASSFMRQETATWKQLLNRTANIVYRTTRKAVDSMGCPQRMWYLIDIDTEQRFTTPQTLRYTQKAINQVTVNT